MERPPITSLQLFIYMAKRIDDLEKLHQEHRALVADMHEKMVIENRFSLAHALWGMLKWTGLFGSHISSILIAAYLAIEHSSFFVKVGKWISMTASML